MKAEIVLVNGASRLSVNLFLNLQSYCQAYQSACKGERTEVFKQQRAVLLDDLFGLAGDLHWMKIKNRLSQQCDLADPFERDLFKLLTNTHDQSVGLQLALESLDTCFIELLKNSIDAMLKHFLEGYGHAKLEMVIDLGVKENQLVVHIVDNAGGFSAGQLDQFNRNILMKNYDFKTDGAGKQAEPIAYYMGGAGLGVAKLSHALMDGRSELKAGLFEKKYDVLPGSTLIQFDNVSLDNSEFESDLKELRHLPLASGAKITLISPQVTCTLRRDDLEESASFCLDSLPNRKRKKVASSSSEPVRYQRSQPTYPALFKCLPHLERGGADMSSFAFMRPGAIK
jgi:hypothetical protein